MLIIPMIIFVWNGIEDIKLRNDVGRYRLLFQAGTLGPSIKNYIDVVEEVSSIHNGFFSDAQRTRLAEKKRVILSHLSAVKSYIELTPGVGEENKLDGQVLLQVARIQSTLDAIDIDARKSAPLERVEPLIGSLEDSMAFFEGTLIGALETDMFIQVRRANLFSLVIRILFSVFLLSGTMLCHLLLVLRRKNGELSDFATLDTLTGLLNRRSVIERVNSFIILSQRTDAPLSVAVIDLDHFKNINDTYGHPTGDIVLKIAANTIDTHRRSSDIAARFGGEEFIIVMFNTQTTEALSVCERVRSELEAVMPSVDDNTIPITASIGMVSLNSTSANFETMYRLADRALYQAKHNGRNRTVVAHA
jgi:diguanylate cyclase (GGDEF)-like protein